MQENQKRKTKSKKGVIFKAIVIILVLLLSAGVSLGVSMYYNKPLENSIPAMSTVKDGPSAYELAVLNGYEGDLQQWLNSLSGKSAFEIAVENGYKGSEQDWADSLQTVINQEGALIKNASFSYDGDLIITLSDNSVINLGKAVGKNGENGKDGQDGRGNASMEIVNGELIVTYTDNTTQNLGSVGSSGSDDTSDNILIYTLLPDGTYGVKAGAGAENLAVITIPDTYNGVAVTQILANGFANNTSLMQINLPNSLLEIGNNAFDGCIGLEFVELPNTLTSIGNMHLTVVPVLRK